jgi:hypothetical protein
MFQDTIAGKTVIYHKKISNKKKFKFSMKDLTVKGIPLSFFWKPLYV